MHCRAILNPICLHCNFVSNHPASYVDHEDKSILFTCPEARYFPDCEHAKQDTLLLWPVKKDCFFDFVSCTTMVHPRE